MGSVRYVLMSVDDVMGCVCSYCVSVCNYVV